MGENPIHQGASHNDKDTVKNACILKIPGGIAEEEFCYPAWYDVHGNGFLL